MSSCCYSETEYNARFQWNKLWIFGQFSHERIFFSISSYLIQFRVWINRNNLFCTFKFFKSEIVWIFFFALLLTKRIHHTDPSINDNKTPINLFSTRVSFISQYMSTSKPLQTFLQTSSSYINIFNMEKKHVTVAVAVGNVIHSIHCLDFFVAWYYAEIQFHNKISQRNWFELCCLEREWPKGWIEFDTPYDLMNKPTVNCSGNDTANIQNAFLASTGWWKSCNDLDQLL